VEKEENINEIIKSYKNKIKEIKTSKDDEIYNYRNLGGEKELITIYTYTTDNVPDIRDNFSKHYEANIKFTEVFKRDKLIKGYFYVPDWIFNSKERVYKIKGINYIMLFENEISGGELIF
jgi:DNA polymerase elongation subunit (family B)